MATHGNEKEKQSAYTLLKHTQTLINKKEMYIAVYNIFLKVF